MGYENIAVTREGATMVITINRPTVRNALDPATWRELDGAAAEAAGDPTARVVVITGAGGKSFAAGADLKALAARSPLETLDLGPQPVLDRIASLPRPTIAAINGWALGGGLELALACDIRIAADNARLGLPETGLGIIPGVGGTQRLPRLVGVARAKELIFTGAILDAGAAERIGLVNRVVPAADLMPQALAMAAQIAERAPLALRLAKAAIDIAAGADARSGQSFERLAQTFLFTTADRDEGIAAFLEKRTPGFAGR